MVHLHGPPGTLDSGASARASMEGHWTVVHLHGPPGTLDSGASAWASRDTEQWCICMGLQGHWTVVHVHLKAGYMLKQSKLELHEAHVPRANITVK